MIWVFSLGWRCLPGKDEERHSVLLYLVSVDIVFCKIQDG